MLPAFNMLAASVLALAWLAIGLTFPILAVWFGVRVARDLRRIAARMDAVTEIKFTPHFADDGIIERAFERHKHNIANSAFGR